VEYEEAHYSGYCVYFAEDYYFSHSELALGFVIWQLDAQSTLIPSLNEAYLTILLQSYTIKKLLSAKY